MFFFFSLYVIYFCDCQITSEGDISLLVLQRSKCIQSYALEEKLQPGTDISFTSLFFARESFIASFFPACCLGRKKTESPQREDGPGLDNQECLSECPIPGKGNCHLRAGTKWLIFLRVPGVFCSPSRPALPSTLQQHVRQRD